MNTKRLFVQKPDATVTAYTNLQKQLRSLSKIKSSLADANQGIHLMQKVGNIAIFEWNILTNRFVASPNLKEIYGITDKNFTGNKFTDWLPFVHPKDKIGLRQALKEAILKNREVQYEYRVLTSKKQARWIEVRAKVVFNALHIPTKVIGVKTDVTERKEKESQKDNFISMASHELRTPLTVIKLHQHMILKKIKNMEQKDIMSSLEKINSSIEELEKLIKNLLDASQIKKGQLPLHKTPILLRNIIKEAVTDIQPLTEHQIDLTCLTKAYILADHVRLREVIKNILLNAIKYSPFHFPIYIDVTEQKKHLVVAITDRGIGIPLDQQDKIFEQFFQVENPLGENTYPGLGVGLYISSEIVRQHNGKIRVKSIEGKGSTFFIHLPIFRK